MDIAISIVKFRDTLEDDNEEHFGILFEDGTVLCLCCGGVLEPEDHVVTKNYQGFAYVDETLHRFYD